MSGEQPAAQHRTGRCQGRDPAINLPRATMWGAALTGPLCLAVALAALRLGVARLAAGLGALHAAWTLYGAGIGASGLSLVLILAGLPLYWWTPRQPALAAA